MKKKGFTLIELLAVIIILAVIALIATPVVLNVIEKANKSAAVQSANGILDTLRLKMTGNELTGETIESGQYILEGQKLYSNNEEYQISYNGGEGATGTIVIEENKVVSACFNIDDYDVYYDGTIAKNEECENKKTLKETLSDLPTKKVNINGQVVNKVYGESRTSLKNYVWYSGQLWQVLEVNDDTIKMITAEPLTSISYGETSNYKTSWVRDWLNEEFLSVLTRKDLIVPTTYCLDSPNVVTTDVTYSSTSQDKDLTLKVVNSHEKINTCSNVITENVGLMTFEDYVYAYDAENPNYTEVNFVYHDELDWTMSPYSDNKVWLTWFETYPYITVEESYNLVKFNDRPVRPVISIKSSAIVSSGTGENSNPYVLTSEKIVEENEFISNVKVGDYIFLDETNNPYEYSISKVTSEVTYNPKKAQVRYRVVKINEDGTIKVQRADILRSLPSEISISSYHDVLFYYNDSEIESERCMRDISGKYGVKYTYYTNGCAENNIFNPEQGTGDYKYTDSENLGYFLNNADNSFYNWYSNQTKEMIMDTNWNLPAVRFSVSYKTVLSYTDTTEIYPSNKSDGIITAKVGLPQYGEIYSSNDLNIQYWLINRAAYSYDKILVIGTGGSAYTGYVASSGIAIRPVVVLKQAVKIDSGKGTMTEPYNLKI